MSDKDLSESVEEFFDIQALASVLIAFVLTEWIETILVLIFGMEAMIFAVVWPVVFFALVIILANVGKEADRRVTEEEFKEEVVELKQEIRDTNGDDEQ